MQYPRLFLFFIIFIPCLGIAQLPLASPGIEGKSHPLTTVLMGRLSVAGGSAIPNAVAVVLDCANRVRARGFSDGKGNFSLTISVLETKSFLTNLGPENGVVTDPEWPTCEIYGDLGGYQSNRIRLSGGVQDGIVEVGMLVLRPLQPQRGSATVSVTSLAAPKKAQEAVQKGKEQAKKGRWSAAADYFKKALAVYPRYALAWMELGRMQIKENNFQQAEQSLQQAVSHDSGFLPAYAELARVAAAQRQWKQLADISERVVQTSPDASPEFWLLNAAANYNLGNLADARSSAERGLRVDTEHNFPQLEYLYGLILARDHDFKSAAEHISAYLQLQPQAPDAEAARTQLTEYQRLAR